MLGQQFFVYVVFFYIYISGKKFQQSVTLITLILNSLSWIADSIRGHISFMKYHNFNCMAQLKLQ